MTALLDVKAAARYLGIGFSTLNKARVSGAGPKYSEKFSVASCTASKTSTVS